MTGAIFILRWSCFIEYRRSCSRLHCAPHAVCAPLSVQADYIVQSADHCWSGHSRASLIATWEAQGGGRFLVVHRYLGQVLRLIRGATNVQGATTDQGANHWSEWGGKLRRKSPRSLTGSNLVARSAGRCVAQCVQFAPILCQAHRVESGYYLESDRQGITISSCTTTNCIVKCHRCFEGTAPDCKYSHLVVTTVCRQRFAKLYLKLFVSEISLKYASCD